MRREPRFSTVARLRMLREACASEYGDVVMVLGLAGLRWGEVAGLQVGDLVDSPGRGMRIQRAVLVSRESGQLYVDTLKSKRARTVPLVTELHTLVDLWAEGKGTEEWVFAAPQGGPLREANWMRT